MSVEIGPQPIVQGITIVQGATFSAFFPWSEAGVPQSLEGFTAKFAIARKRGKTVAPMVEVTSAPGGSITLEPYDDNNAPRTGIVWVRLSPSDTHLVTKAGVYDLWLIDNDDPTEVLRLYEGPVTVDLEASEVE